MGSAFEDKQEVARLEKESEVIQRRRQGQTFDIIAKDLGYANRSGVYKVYQKAVERLRAEVTESADELRWMEHQRNESILRGGLWARAQRGEHVAIQDFLAIQRSTREMFGLDAPKTTQLQGPGGSSLLSGLPKAADAARLVREMFGDHAARKALVEDDLDDEQPRAAADAGEPDNADAGAADEAEPGDAGLDAVVVPGD